MKPGKSTKLLRGGGNTVSVQVTAEVRLHCGERLYAEDVVRTIEEIRSKLQKQDFIHLQTLGQSFTVEGESKHENRYHDT